MQPEPLPPLERRVNHVLHLVVGFFTCGLWWLIWPLVIVDTNRANQQAWDQYRWEHQQWQMTVHRNYYR